MIKLMISWTITRKDLPFLSTQAFDSLNTTSSAGRESKEDETFAWGFMPPYCHGEDQTWWYVGWLVVFWSGFHYWHCLFRSLSWKVLFAASHTLETSHRFPRPSDIWTDIPLWRPTMFKSLHFINRSRVVSHGLFFEEFNTFSGTVFIGGLGNWWVSGPIRQTHSSHQMMQWMIDW